MYRIRSISPRPLEKVRLLYHPELDQSLSGPEFNHTKIRWRKMNRKRIAESKPPLQNLPLFLPGQIRQYLDRIDIPCGRTSYMSTLFHSAFCKDWSAPYTGAGLSIVPVCPDGVLIGKRSGFVNLGEHLFHVAAGHAHPKPDFISHPDELTGAVLQELEEEMAIECENIERMEFLGIGLNQLTGKTEFLTRVVLPENSEFYIRRWRAAIRNQKHPEFDELSTLDRIIGPDPYEVHRTRFTVACQMALEAHRGKW
jgi:hypothetical protein